MQSSLTTHALKFRLISIPRRVLVVSLKLLLVISFAFFSLYLIAAIGNTACINSVRNVISSWSSHISQNLQPLIYRIRLSTHEEGLGFLRCMKYQCKAKKIEHLQPTKEVVCSRSTWRSRKKVFVYDTRSEPRSYISWITYLDLYYSLSYDKYLAHCLIMVAEFKFRLPVG